MYVFARVNAYVGDILVKEGDVWDASDPFVKANPSLFDDSPRRVRRSTPEVEAATAAPGEKRGRRG